VINNRIINGGYVLTDSTLTIENNFVNNKELGFFANQNDMAFTSNQFGQVILISCSNFTIKNQEITNTTNGFMIITCNDITIEENAIRNSVYGIYVEQSSNLNIYSNVISNNTEEGIVIVDSENVSIENNTSNKNHSGLRLDNCPNIEVLDNSINYNDYGISLVNSPNSLVDGNLVSDNGHNGIGLTHSPGSIISNNTMYGAGIEFFMFENLGTYLSYELLNNTLNNKRIGFYKNVHNASLPSEGFGQLFLINCSNFLIENQIFQGVEEPLQIFYCIAVIIKNTTFTENFPNRMIIYMSKDCILLNNTYENDGGVWLFQSSNLTIMNNVFLNASLYLQSSVDCTLFNNTFEKDASVGISTSFNITISNNVFSEIREIGFYDIRNCTFSYNSIINTTYGINGNGFRNCTVKYNLFLQNENYALEIAFAYHSIYHHNAFIDNNLGGTSQAFERSATNSTWYDETTLEGNFWNDWLGVGNYSIDGDAGSIDPFPLLSNPL
jgi:parallel beta-helix repeat protein